MKFKNNEVVLSGEVETLPEFHHEKIGERFFMFHVKTQRTSGVWDILPVLMSEKLKEIYSIKVGCGIYIKGNFRSYNKVINDKGKLILYIFVNEAEISESFSYMQNEISISGYICKKPVYRETPMGREIADVHVAVNRPYGKSDYIPVIAWGRNARFVNDLAVGSFVEVKGRIQSRKYLKPLEDGTAEERIAYEVSAANLKLGEPEGRNNNGDDQRGCD